MSLDVIHVKSRSATFCLLSKWAVIFFLIDRMFKNIPGLSFIQGNAGSPFAVNRSRDPARSRQSVNKVSPSV